MHGSVYSCAFDRRIYVVLSMNVNKSQNPNDLRKRG